MKKLILILLLLTFWSCSKRDESLKDDPFISERILKINNPRLVPDFTLPSNEGRDISIDEYRGRVVLINFWASWCGPCVAEMDSIERLSNSLSDDFKVVLINIGEDEESVDKFLKNGGYSMTTLYDRDKRVASMFGVRSIPSTLILDSQGRVVANKIGAHEWDREGVKKILHIIKEN